MMFLKLLTKVLIKSFVRIFRLEINQFLYVVKFLVNFVVHVLIIRWSIILREHTWLRNAFLVLFSFSYVLKLLLSSRFGFQNTSRTLVCKFILFTRIKWLKRLVIESNLFLLLAGKFLRRWILVGLFRKADLLLRANTF